MNERNRRGAWLEGWRAAGVVAGLLWCAGPAAAQTVVGQVVEEGTLRPLRGTFIVLEDEAGKRRGGVLSGEDGRFVLRSPAPGRYRLVAELIGYAGARTDPLDLGVGETVRRTIAVSVEAVSLEGIEVETEARCRRRPGSGPATARLWEEARKALEVARWSESERALKFAVVDYRRELDASTLRVLKQTERARERLYDTSPYRSIPAERLEEGGYIQEVADGSREYFAPDAEVLLSESFLSTHCFRVEGGPDPDLVGLAFEPVPERELSDIEGALWLARGTGELKRLDFRYVNVPAPHVEFEQVGGRVEFERLATGMWIVRRWRIRMPLEAATAGGHGGSARYLTLVRLVEDGAEVRSARTRDGRVLSEAVGATLYGTAVEGGAIPLADATVELLPLGRTARTALDGAYRLDGLPEGNYAVRLAHPDLGLLGLEPVERAVELEAGRAIRLPLDAGLTPDRAADLCREADAGEGAAGAIVYGRVRDRAGGPVKGALVRYDTGAGERRAVADSAGVFRLCVAAGAPVRLAASTGAASGVALADLRPEEVAAPASGFTRVDLVAAQPVARTAPEARPTWRNAVIGAVLEEGSREPVSAATITLTDDAGSAVATAISDDRGRFTITHPGRGERFGVRVERIGYATSEGEVAFGDGQELRLEVLLATRAIELESIVVTERRRGLLVDVGYYQRLEKGAGVFVQREEIERRRPARTTDLFRGVSGMRVIAVDGLRRDVRLATTTTFRDANRECQPKVYVDGTLARSGGEVRRTGNTDPMAASLDDLVEPGLIEGMEVYRRASEIPAQYGGADAACGVIVIWTRRGT